MNEPSASLNGTGGEHARALTAISIALESMVAALKLAGFPDEDTDLVSDATRKAITDLIRARRR